MPQKHPARGVCEFMIYVDDLLVMSAELSPAPYQRDVAGKDFGQYVLFCSQGTPSQKCEQQIVCYNDGSLVAGNPNSLASAPSSTRPQTAWATSRE